MNKEIKREIRKILKERKKERTLSEFSLYLKESRENYNQCVNMRKIKEINKR